MSKIKSLFFDLDGTLVDTEKVALRTIAKYAQRLGISIDNEDYEFITGRKWSLGVEHLHSKYHLSGTPNEIETEVLELYRMELKLDVPAIPGSPNFLSRVSKKYPIYCVSGSHRVDIEFCLNALGCRSLFQGVVGCEDYEQSKPSPAAYEVALERAKLNPKEVIVFEDSHAGVASALSANCRVVQIGSLQKKIPAGDILECFLHYDSPEFHRFCRTQLECFD